MRKVLIPVCALLIGTSLSCQMHSSPVPDTSENNVHPHTVKTLHPDLPLEKAESPPVAYLPTVSIEVEDAMEDIVDVAEDNEEPVNEEPIVEDVEEEHIVDTLSYTEEDLYVLSHVINGEACGYSWEHQIGVGSVVLNRVKDERFPNTIKEVVFQKGQYACTWDGNYDREPEEQAVEAAKYLLENGSQMPEYTIFQSEFLQGDSVYTKIGNTYFCYWKEDVK